LNNISYETEQAVIGVIVSKAADNLPLIVSELQEEAFTVSEYRTVYKTALELFRENKEVDIVTLLAKLGDEYKETLYHAAEALPTAKNIKAYIKIVRENGQRVKAKSKVYELIDSLDGITDIAACQEIAADILKCFDISSKENTVSAMQGYIDFCKRQNTLKKYIKTGFATLDRYTYFDKGDYVVIGARPSAGKTAFTLQMLTHIAKEYKTVYFSLETSPAKIFERLIANQTGTALSNIKNGDILDNQWVNIAQSGDRFTKLNFSVVQAAGWTVEQIKSKALQLGAEVIFIDYIGLIKGEGKSQYEKATAISNDLHTMAQRYGIAVIALSQLNREGKGSPDMTHLRDSGAIEQDADVILLLRYDDETPDKRDLSIVKNKEGNTGFIPLRFIGELQRFSEIDTKH